MLMLTTMLGSTHLITAAAAVHMASSPAAPAHVILAGEPTSMAMMAVGLVGMALTDNHRRRTEAKPLDEGTED